MSTASRDFVFHVFISASQRDKKAAEAIAHQLEHCRRFEVEVFFSPSALASHLEAAPTGAVLLLWSKNRKPKQGQLTALAVRAWSADRLLILKIDDAPLPLGLRDLYVGSVGRGHPLPDMHIDDLQRRASVGLPGTVMGDKYDPSSPQQVASADVFVSYSSMDVEIVDHVVSLINSLSFGYSRYAAKISLAMRHALVVALMCSRNAFESDHVVREIYLAADFKKPFIAIQLDKREIPDEAQYFLTGFPRILAIDLDSAELRLRLQQALQA